MKKYHIDLKTDRELNYSVYRYMEKWVSLTCVSKCVALFP